MNFAIESATSQGDSISLGLRVDTIKVGINYRWGGPIVAKY
jgi:hypothetical protein